MIAGLEGLSRAESKSVGAEIGVQFEFRDPRVLFEPPDLSAATNSVVGFVTGVPIVEASARSSGASAAKATSPPIPMTPIPGSLTSTTGCSLRMGACSSEDGAANDIHFALALHIGEDLYGGGQRQNFPAGQRMRLVVESGDLAQPERFQLPVHLRRIGLAKGHPSGIELAKNLFFRGAAEILNESPEGAALLDAIERGQKFGVVPDEVAFQIGRRWAFPERNVNDESVVRFERRAGDRGCGKKGRGISGPVSKRRGAASGRVSTKSLAE